MKPYLKLKGMEQNEIDELLKNAEGQAELVERIKKVCKGGSDFNNPSSYLKKALANQGIDSVPKKMKETVQMSI